MKDAALLLDSRVWVWSHGDPADRVLVATALFHNLQLVTADSVILDHARSNRALRVIDAAR